MVGTCPTCGDRVEDSDGNPARSQKIPWHFWVFASAAALYLAWRLLEGVVELVT
ncbi:MAG TPA: hypothetical protein QF865_01155 [Acidimicrobiales bacterium]|nr:hypothetical protein [Acidimicrobiales bacterium]HJO18930.1 hypothetical protein [Acidimicrobiales bacterium]